MSEKKHIPYLTVERLGLEDVKRQAEKLSGSVFAEIFDTYPVMTMILNDCRQIVYANARAKELSGAETAELILGKRPGEAFACEHSNESGGGCGTSVFCPFCGAANSLKSALGGGTGMEECSLSRRRGPRLETLDLLVWTRPISYEGESLILFSTIDISDQKRREILEKTFYHDIVNTAGAVKSVFNFLEFEKGSENGYFVELAKNATERFIEEILSHKDLKAAEEDFLSANFHPFKVRELMESEIKLIGIGPGERGLKIKMRETPEGLEIVTDPILLGRVLRNMLKNAIEASTRGKDIGFEAAIENGELRISVSNQAYMPPEVQRQVFKRSFSTKGAGRGIGTYSMKLLTEKYLGGRAEFSSSEGEGTVFSVFLPLLREQEYAGKM